MIKELACLISLTVTLVTCGCMGSGSDAQTFDTNFGQIQINTPETLEPTFGSIRGQGMLSGLSVLSLGKKGSGMPLLIITLTENNQLMNFQNSVSAAQMIMQNGRHMTTNDGHQMYWASTQIGSLKEYQGCIDYENDRGLFVDIKGLSETVDPSTGKSFPGLSESEALDIFKSFKFVENSDSKDEELASNTASASSAPINPEQEHIDLGHYVVSFDLGNIGAYNIKIEEPEEDENGTVYLAVIDRGDSGFLFSIIEAYENMPIPDVKEKLKEGFYIPNFGDCEVSTLAARTIDGKPGTVFGTTCSNELFDGIFYPVEYNPQDNTMHSAFMFVSIYPEDEGKSRDEVISNLLETIHVEKQSTPNALSETNLTSTSKGQEADEFHVVVIGDSIAWGNGLNKEDKYPYLIADWLDEKLDRPVDVTVYAHSGAAISGESGESIDPNLNSGTPTLMDQAKKIENKDDVDLILVSGGINDVGVMNILNAYTPSDDIDKSAQSIQEPMKDLLSSLLSECKNAKIIVTSYYPIVSEKSEIKTITALYGLGVFFINDATGGNVLDAVTVKERLIENSYMFNSGSLMALNKAIRDADNGARRVSLGLVNFKPENCYAASQTWLWKLDGLGTNDDQFEYRSTLSSDPINKINAIGHPNRDGAIEYSRAIKTAIESRGLDWLENDAAVHSDSGNDQGVAGSDTASVNEPTSDIYPSEDGDTYDENMKTAYTQDGINFISEERLEQNIRVGVSKLADYKKVQVPLDTIVAEASPEGN